MHETALKWNFYPITLESQQEMSSASMPLLMITSDLRMVISNIWRRVVGSVLMNISPSNIFQIALSHSRCNQRAIYTCKLGPGFHPNRQSARGCCQQWWIDCYKRNGMQNARNKVRYLLDFLSWVVCLMGGWRVVKGWSDCRMEGSSAAALPSTSSQGEGSQLRSSSAAHAAPFIPPRSASLQ